MMDFSRWTRKKSIIAPSVKKYRVYTPIGGWNEELYTGRKKIPFRKDLKISRLHGFIHGIFSG